MIGSSRPGMLAVVPLVLFGTILVFQPASLRLHAEEASDSPSEAEQCAECHDDMVESFRLTDHAIAKGWDLATACSSCHGPGQAHMESGDPADIRNLRNLSPHDSSQVCLDCHKTQQSFRYHQSLHNLSDVGCIDCHSSHSTRDHMLRKSTSDLCTSCHGNVLAQFELPRSHPLGKGNTVTNGCVSCHDPHGTKNVRNLRGVGSSNCVACHVEYRGPFVYNHDVAIVDGCQACHQVHGTPNRHLLKATRLINLCYQCHPGTTTPSFHSAATFKNELCTACHTAIHGSNTNSFFLEE